MIVNTGETLDLTGQVWERQESLVVMSGGTLLGGPGTQVLIHVPDDRLFLGNLDPDNEMAWETDLGIWIMPGATWKFIDPNPRTEWLFASKIGAGTAWLQGAPAGWLPGDELLLMGADGSKRQTVLTSASSNQVKFQDGTFASVPYVDVTGVTISPVVANLTRNIIIRSADVKLGDYSHRAHTIAMGDHMTGDHPHVHLTGVAFVDLGPRGNDGAGGQPNTLGRYAWHGHHAGHAGHGDNVTSCVFRDTFWNDPLGCGSRKIVVHETSGYQLLRNLILGGKGHPVLLGEDGSEIGNVFDGNVVTGIRRGEFLPVPDWQKTMGTNALWARWGNQFTNNVLREDPKQADRADMGLGIVSSRSSQAVEMPMGPNECSGHYQYPSWSSKSGLVLPGLTSAFGRTNGFWANGKVGTVIQLQAPNLVQNGTAGVDYEGGAYSQQSELSIIGGCISGKRGVHPHYDSKLTAKGVNIIIQPDPKQPGRDCLCDMSYWEEDTLIDSCVLNIQNLVASKTWAKRRQAPGVLRVVNCAPQWDGVYVGPFHAIPQAFIERDIIRGGVLVARKLKEPIPALGFIRCSLGMDVNTLWSVTLKGVPATPLTAIREREADWLAALAVGQPGWLEGFLPGDYDVVATRGAQRVQKTVTVVSGQAVDV